MSKKGPSIGTSLRRLIVFQIKLAADAVRDLLLSPLSILMFILDVLFRPENSFYDWLMRLGRRSDQIINLFEQHTQEAEAKPAPEV
jgi:hypothetical protein